MRDTIPDHNWPRPTVIHTYQNHVLDSTLWQRFKPRDVDIVITTSYKSGTTWMRAILAHLILGTHAIPDINKVSPMIDSRHAALDDTFEQLEAQQHRRFVKSHLPLDGLPFYPQVKYIVVGMKQHAQQWLPRAESVWHGGAQTFIFKGTNGRWRTVLSEAELAQYTESVAAVLDPACARWLEGSRLEHH